MSSEDADAKGDARATVALTKNEPHTTAPPSRRVATALTSADWEAMRVTHWKDPDVPGVRLATKPCEVAPVGGASNATPLGPNAARRGQGPQVHDQKK